MPWGRDHDYKGLGLDWWAQARQFADVEDDVGEGKASKADEKAWVEACLTEVFRESGLSKGPKMTAGGWAPHLRGGGGGGH